MLSQDEAVRPCNITGSRTKGLRKGIVRLFTRRPPMSTRTLRRHTTRLIEGLTRHPVLHNTAQHSRTITVSTPNEHRASHFSPAVTFNIPGLRRPVHRGQYSSVISHLPQRRHMLTSHPLQHPVVILRMIRGTRRVVQRSNSTDMVQVHRIGTVRFVRRRVSVAHSQ